MAVSDQTRRVPPPAPTAPGYGAGDALRDMWNGTTGDLARFAWEGIDRNIGQPMGKAFGAGVGAIEGALQANSPERWQPGATDPLTNVGLSTRRGFDEMRGIGQAMGDIAPGSAWQAPLTGIGMGLDFAIDPAHGLGKLGHLDDVAKLGMAGAMPLASLFGKLTPKVELVGGYNPEFANEMARLIGAPEGKPLNSVQIMAALEKYRRINHGPPVTGLAEQASEYGRVLTEDVASGLGRMRGIDEFYPDAARATRDLYPQIGQSMTRVPGYEFASEAFQNPKLVNLFSALSVPLSSQTAPDIERGAALIGSPEFLKLFGTGQMSATDALVMEAGKSHGGFAWKPGSFNEGIGMGTRLTKPGESTFGSYRALGGVIDSFQGTPMQKLEQFSDWLNADHPIEEIVALRQWVMPESGMTKAFIGSHFSPQSVNQGMVFDKSKLSGQRVKGWALLGPKTGPYAEASATGTSATSVFDDQAARAMFARLGGAIRRSLGRNKGQRAVTDAELEELLPAINSLEKTALRDYMTERGFSRAQGPRGYDDRWVYQEGQAEAARNLGKEVPQIQAPDWGMGKGLLVMGGSDTPTSGTVATAVQQGAKLADRTGLPYMPSTKKILTADEITDYRKNKKLTPEQVKFARRQLKEKR